MGTVNRAGLICSGSNFDHQSKVTTVQCLVLPIMAKFWIRVNLLLLYNLMFCQYTNNVFTNNLGVKSRNFDDEGNY